MSLELALSQDNIDASTVVGSDEERVETSEIGLIHRFYRRLKLLS